LLYHHDYILYKLLQTVLGIKTNWYGKHSYNNDTIYLLKPGHNHKSMLDDLITFFLRVPYIIYKILFKTSTISVYRYVWCINHTHSISHIVPQQSKKSFTEQNDCWQVTHL